MKTALALSETRSALANERETRRVLRPLSGVLIRGENPWDDAVRPRRRHPS